jgi:hypothetical protein
MRSISRSEFKPNSSELDNNEARGEFLSVLSGCVHELPELTGEENPGWPGRGCGARRRSYQYS